MTPLLQLDIKSTNIQAAIIDQSQKLNEGINLCDQLAKVFNPKIDIMNEIIQEALSPNYHRLHKAQGLLGKPISFDNDFNILVDGQPAKIINGS